MSNNFGLSTLSFRQICVLLAVLIVSISAMEGAAPGARNGTNGFRFVDLSPAAAPQGSEASKRFGAIQDGLQWHDGVPFMLGDKLAITGLESSQIGDIYPTEARLPIS